MVEAHAADAVAPRLHEAAVAAGEALHRAVLARLDQLRRGRRALLVEHLLEFFAPVRRIVKQRKWHASSFARCSISMCRTIGRQDDGMPAGSVHLAPAALHFPRDRTHRQYSLSSQTPQT